MQPHLFNYQNLHIMAIGLFWLPDNLKDYSEWSTTCYTVTALNIRDDIKYDLQIAHPADDFSLVNRWINICRAIDVYMVLPDEQGILRNWLFKSALPSGGDLANGRFTVVCSKCNVQEVSSLPLIFGSSQNLAARGIELAGARRAAYR